MNRNLATLLYFTLILSATIIFLPKSLMGFYHVQAFSAIYLPNLTDTTLKSTMEYTAFMKILSLLFSGNPLLISNIAGIDSVLSVLFSYILFFRVVEGDYKVKFIVSLLYPVVIICMFPANIFAGYVLGLSMILYFMIYFFFLNERSKDNYISLFFVSLISWISLGLFWNTVYTMVFLIVVIYIVIYNLCHAHKRQSNKILLQWNLLILFIVSFIFTWLYLKENVIYDITELKNFGNGIPSIFNKGSFTGIYTYNHSLRMYLEYVDIIRYLGYLLAYIIILLFTIEFATNIIRKINVSKNQMFLIALFISDLFFMFLYFISTGVLENRILLTFSYPLILIMLNSDQQLSIKCLNNSNLRLIITLFLMTSLILTSVFSFYNYLTESPEQNISINTYNNSFKWISEYSDVNMIISDAHTSGHYQLLYLLNNVFNKKQINFNTLSSAEYEDVVDSTYYSSDNTLLVINEILYKKHLQFQSLQAWNTFEPLSSQCLGQNTNLNEIYSDGRMTIAQ